MWGGDYLGVNGRQDAIIASRHRKQWQLCGIWQKCSLVKNKTHLDKQK
jgi:hypothetical protein